ncbi:class I mannose-6-phosphate isomerase [bacterium]|nr:class I mannose-6-phosphate isomerase [bacterium]
MLTMPPLRFHPILKQIRWGGTRLGTALGKPIGARTDCAESWEISDHGEDQSVVLGGPFAGATLNHLVQTQRRELFGADADRFTKQFPLLIKFLDANDRLSIQVHPDDALARTYDPTENGKTEAWIVISAEPGSRLYAGLKAGVDATDLRAAIAAGRLEDCLHSFEVTAGDCVFIPAGTVHAITEGILLAEVQQSSDLTFRLHDWGRVGADGKPRPLHIKDAIRCTDFERGPVSRVAPTAIDGIEGGEEVIHCDFFSIRRYSGGGEVTLPSDNRFHILMGLAGTSQIKAGATSGQLSLGDTVLLPASRESTTLHRDASAIVLDVFIP